MSLLNAIKRFSTAVADGASAGYVVTRSAADVIDPTTGLAIPSAPATLLIDASIQPYSGHGLRVLPESYHTEDVCVIYTATELLLAPVPDHVSYRGTDYEVIKVNGPFNMSGVATYQVYAARQAMP